MVSSRYKISLRHCTQRFHHIVAFAYTLWNHPSLIHPVYGHACLRDTIGTRVPRYSEIYRFGSFPVRPRSILKHTCGIYIDQHSKHTSTPTTLLRIFHSHSRVRTPVPVCIKYTNSHTHTCCTCASALAGVGSPVSSQHGRLTATY